MKALLRSIGADVPKIRDVGKYLEKFKQYLPAEISNNLDEIRRISKSLRKERELAFYGAEDFIPLEEYTREEAEKAIEDAEFVYHIVAKTLEHE